jgi:hypothetical protein
MPGSGVKLTTDLPVIGWHGWLWGADRGRLISWRSALAASSQPGGDAASEGGGWEFGQYHAATCESGERHDVPDVNCRCGISVFPRPLINRDTVANPNMVCGLISGRGRVVEAASFKRCGEARIVAIGCYHRVPNCVCRDVAQRYGVELYLRPHQQMMARAIEEGASSRESADRWRSYETIMPTLRRIVSLEYGCERGRGKPVIDAEIEIAAEAETAASDSVALKHSALLSRDWWDAYMDYLTGMLVPYRQTELVANSLLGLLNRYGVSSQSQAVEVESSIYLMALTGLAGQFSRHAGSLFEWLRECWRAGVSYEVDIADIHV